MEGEVRAHRSRFQRRGCSAGVAPTSRRAGSRLRRHGAGVAGRFLQTHRKDDGEQEPAVWWWGAHDSALWLLLFFQECRKQEHQLREKVGV